MMRCLYESENLSRDIGLHDCPECGVKIMAGFPHYRYYSRETNEEIYTLEEETVDAI